jgi:Phage tail protein (Tail_P2_I)
MPAPSNINQVAADLYDDPGLSPWVERDAANDYSLLWWLSGIAKMFEQVNDLVNARNNSQPNWSRAVSLDQCPPELLPWLGQFVGVRHIVGGDVEPLRDRIRLTDGFKRGTLAAVRAAGLSQMTGTGLRITERVDGNAYRAALVADPAQVPDQAAFETAVMRAKPVGLVFSFYYSAAPLLFEYTRSLSAVTQTIDIATLSDVT